MDFTDLVFLTSHSLIIKKKIYFQVIFVCCIFHMSFYRPWISVHALCISAGRCSRWIWIVLIHRTRIRLFLYPSGEHTGVFEPRKVITCYFLFFSHTHLCPHNQHENVYFCVCARSCWYRYNVPIHIDRVRKMKTIYVSLQS